MGDDTYEELMKLTIEVPAGETVLKEGAAGMKGALTGKSGQKYKYAITDKGVWTCTKGGLLSKTKSEFLPYDTISQFISMVQNETEFCYFYPKKGNIPTVMYFDDPQGVVEVLVKYIKKAI